MSRRATELFLLCAAAPLIVLVFVMLALTQGQQLGFSVVAVPAGVFFLFIVAHLAVRKLAPSADPALLPIAFALTGIGIVFITRINANMASQQLLWLGLCIAAFIAVLALVKSIDDLAKYKYLMAIVGFALLLSPMLPVIGTESYGSRIWLTFGDLSFQPGEIAKIAIVLFLAGYLAHNREMLSVFTWRIGPFELPDARTLLPLLFMWAIAVLIVVFEKDLGSALVFFFVFIAMLYFASGKKLYLIISLLLASGAAIALYFLFSHVQVRVQTWLNPFSDAQNTGYQLVQTLYSLADGGLFGAGIGEGLATLIPVVESDFIFACIAEETGLLGAAAVLLLYLSFAIRGFATAARAKSDVSSFVAAGLTTVIVLQAFIIVGGVTKLIPLTGLTLPLISKGGSSLLMTFISIALLMRCGDEGKSLDEEISSATTIISPNNALGRFQLGKRLTSGMFVFALMFALLVGNLTSIMVFQADSYKNMAGNNHTVINNAKIQRGSISTSDGVLLAQSRQNADGTYTRVYPQKSMAAHVVGYFSEQYGTSGIEASQNDVLTGKKSFANWNDALAAVTGSGTAGNDITLTLNSTIQKAAEDALQGYAGACVVINPTTGAVLGMASGPTYDNTQLEKALSSTDNSMSVFNRATQALYAPGSTFKIVSLTSALESGVASEDTSYYAPGTMEIGNANVSNFDSIDYGTITLARATEVSSNTAYGQLGVDLGAKNLVATADRFGFDTDISFELPLVSSLMANPNEMTTWELAWAAAGEPVGEKSEQHKSAAGPQATVLEMALVGCAIANDGVIEQPYLVDSIYNANGERSYTAKPSTLLKATDSSTAQRVRAVLEGVVNNGTGQNAAISGIQIAGKTGTAELNDGNNYWFVGMGPSDDSSVVVALVIEKGEAGIATSRAKDVMEAALRVQGVL